MDKDIKDGIIESFAGNLIRLGNECRDHALEVKRLKAELANLKTEADRLKDENQLVREESDRHYQLWVDSQAELEEARRGSGAGMKAMLGLSDDLVAENARLKAEVERLRKAGDEVIHEWSSGHGTDVENFTKALWVWAVAKEGKQS